MLELVTAPTSEPVTLPEAKAYMRVTSSADDALITAFISAAREKCEWFTGRRFITQTWRLWLDRFPRGQKDEWWNGVRDGMVANLFCDIKEIGLILAPVASVTSVKYILQDGVTEQTFTTDNYFCDGASTPGRVVLQFGKIWPVDVLRPAQAVKVDFVVGYGLATAVPASISTAIKELTGFLYRNRGDAGCDANEIPLGVRTLLDPYVIKVL